MEAILEDEEPVQNGGDGENKTGDESADEASATTTTHSDSEDTTDATTSSDSK